MIKTEKPPVDVELRRRIQELIDYKGGGHNEGEDDQTTFSDISSDLVLRPRSWLMFESLTRYNVEDGQFNLAYNSATIYPSDVWSWTVGQFYLRDNDGLPPEGWGEGNNVFMNSFLLRLSQNWAIRATHHFEARDGRMEEQSYTLYRDLRSWTAAISVRLRDSQEREDDFTIAFTFSLKAFPRAPLGSDILRPYTVLQ